MTGTHVVHWRDGEPVEIRHFGDWLSWHELEQLLDAPAQCPIRVF